MNKQRIPPVDPATAIGTNKKNFDEADVVAALQGESESKRPPTGCEIAHRSTSSEKTRYTE